MNKILKAGLSIASASIVWASVAGMSACGNVTDNDNQNVEDNTQTVENNFELGRLSPHVYVMNAYFVVDNTLHKGNSYYFISGHHQLTQDGLELDCGQYMLKNPLEYDVYKIEPEIDGCQKCKGCFKER